MDVVAHKDRSGKPLLSVTDKRDSGDWTLHCSFLLSRKPICLGNEYFIPMQNPDNTIPRMLSHSHIN